MGLRAVCMDTKVDLDEWNMSKLGMGGTHTEKEKS